MKKAFFILYFLFMFSILLPVSKAYFVNNIFNVSLDGDKVINNDKEINIKINIDVSYNLSSILGKLNYEKNKLELVDCKSDSFVCSYKDKLLLDSVEGIKGKKTVANLTFKILNNFMPGEDTIITFNDVEGDNNTKGNKSTIKIHKLQNDTSLTSLEIIGEMIIPDFSPENTIYKLTTIKDEINIEATSNSKVFNTGKKKVNYGNNIFEINVKAENGEEKKYYINVFRNNKDTNKDNNNSIDNIKNNNKQENKSNSNDNTNEVKQNLSSNKKLKYLYIYGSNFTFKENIFEYYIDIDSNIDKLNVNYELEDKKSKVIISGDTEFKDNNNLIILSIIAEDGSQLDYKIHINKNNNKAVKINDLSKNKNKNNSLEKTKKVPQKNNNIVVFIALFILIIIIIYVEKIKEKRH